MSKQVLLCDDEVHILRAAEFKFARAGYDVRCASDGLEAWEMIQEQLPDVLVTDCQMPRMDGLQLVERIRGDERSRHLPIIMLTAKGFELAQADLADKWQVAGVLSKPFSPRELVGFVAQLLETGACHLAPCGEHSA
jgi:two-component system, OmpR family, alkaline phosphatase synthesis response regulator PhoP